MKLLRALMPIAAASICSSASAANFPLAPFTCSLRDARNAEAAFSFQLSRGDGRGQVDLTPLTDKGPLKNKLLFIGTAPSQLVAADGDPTKLTLTIFGSEDTEQGKASFWLAETIGRTATIESFEFNLQIADQKIPSKCVLVAGTKQ